MSKAEGRALWLPDVLRDAGLTVKVVPGWEQRGKDPIEWLCQVFHHTAGPRSGACPSLGTVTEGRGGENPVPGPLCNALPARDGVWHIVAAGAANHPGVSTIPFRGGISSGVKYYALGWECENDGVGEPWAQLDSIEIGEAAVAEYLGWPIATSNIFGHKEIARPHGRKIDPTGIDMDQHRAAVAVRRTHQEELTVADIEAIMNALGGIKTEQAAQRAILDKLDDDVLTKGGALRQTVVDIDKRTSDLASGKRPEKAPGWYRPNHAQAADTALGHPKGG